MALHTSNSNGDRDRKEQANKQKIEFEVLILDALPEMLRNRFEARHFLTSISKVSQLIELIGTQETIRQICKKVKEFGVDLITKTPNEVLIAEPNLTKDQIYEKLIEQRKKPLFMTENKLGDINLSNLSNLLNNVPLQISILISDLLSENHKPPTESEEKTKWYEW